MLNAKRMFPADGCPAVYARLMSLGRAFNVLWGANAASNLADGLAFVSMPLLAASLTDDPRWVAGLATVYALADSYGIRKGDC